MNDNPIQNAKTHNSVLIIMTVACLGAVTESITQGWEYWVPPLIIGGLIVAWGFHLAQYSSMVFRENYYLSFSLMVAFYHGAHESSHEHGYEARNGEVAGGDRSAEQQQYECHAERSSAVDAEDGGSGEWISEGCLQHQSAHGK